jgi:hypothetical protein
MKYIERVAVIACLPDGAVRRVQLRETNSVGDILKALSLDESYKVIYQGEELPLNGQLGALGLHNARVKIEKPKRGWF